MESPVPNRDLPVSVVPVGLDDLEMFEALERDTDTTFRARLRGDTLTALPSATWQDLWSSVLCHYAVLNSRRSEPVGLVTAYRANYRSGHVQLAAVSFPRWQRSGMVLLGAGIVLHRLLTFEPFRKVYLDIAAYNLEQMGNSLDTMFSLEATIPGQFFYNGQEWDQLIYSVTRGQYASSPWFEQAAAAGWVAPLRPAY